MSEEINKYDPKRSLNAIIEEAVKKNWELPAFSDMGGVSYLYKGVAYGIEKMHLIFEASGLKPGDKIALCGKNCSNWALTFIACLTGGYVAVPILHEFKPDNIHHLVNHSEAKILFVDDHIYMNIDNNAMPGLDAIISLNSFDIKACRNEALSEAHDHSNQLFAKKYPRKMLPADVAYYHDRPEDLAVINYTSGSTGHSKGVMLPYRSLWSNIRYCIDNLTFLKPGDGMVNMLPLAHMYGMVIEMLHPFVKGVHCNFLTRLPSPKVIMMAFAQIRPKLIVTVPLILEKIVKGKVFPMLEKPLMKIMMKVPFLDDRILAKVKAGLMEAFGGQLQEIIIGGAALNPEVEEFLNKINFPYTVGYGMTECGPLVTHVPSDKRKVKSVGKIVTRMEGKIDSPDPEKEAGNLWLKGENVMLGYYKNPQATDEAMGKDGWMNTGDLCKIDKDGYVYICGRSKTMILGPSGQNIYPEEIEQKLNNLPYVAESLVIEDGGKLVALIYPDREAAESQGMDEAAIEKVMDDNIKNLNNDLPAYSKISRFKLFDEEFEKTPKRSIKRFLYQP